MLRFQVSFIKLKFRLCRKLSANRSLRCFVIVILANITRYGYLTMMKMTNFYVPYSGEKPFAVSINGHSVIILSKDQKRLKKDLKFIGADTLRELVVGDSEEEQAIAFSSLAQSVECGVVVVPGNIPIKDVIKGLEGELPWLH